ncbi:hypothetical protein P5V15_005216 [Pogonomyrmex californicus]
MSKWEAWVRAICELHGWKHTEPPLIWKQYGISGTKVTYVGDIDKFRELLLDYYNIRFDLTKEELENLKTDLLRAHEIEKKMGYLNAQNECRVTIISADRSLCLDLIPQLMAIKELRLSRGIALSLYDETKKFSKLEEIMKDVKNVEDLNVTVIEDLSIGLYDCDILIFLEDMSRERYEEHDIWYQRNYERMRMLSQQINERAPFHMKIIFCSVGPTCLCATILRDLVANKLLRMSIVAVSAHYGLKVMHDFTESLGMNQRNFGCPPVWGFLDVCHTIQKCDVYKRRNGDAPKAKGSLTTLKSSVMSERAELKWFFSCKNNKNLYEDYLRHKITIEHQADRRKENAQKCKAICDLLKLWYRESIGDEIIALGISSDGSFGIPSGIVFSQPACLKISDNGTRIWIPYCDFPLPDIPVSIFHNLICTAVMITRPLMNADKI